ncbi:MAG: prolyl oligopeptidase family serine peptidase [Acidobacteriota bacterium]
MPSDRYPETRTDDVSDVIFGETVRDPYRWLEDPKDPRVQDWMERQAVYARSRLQALPGRAALVSRLHDLYYLEAEGAPRHRGDRYFYGRNHADREKAVIYWRAGQKGPERVLLDPNQMSEDGSTSLGVWVPSWDGLHVAYTLHENNADEATLYVMEVATGTTSAIDVIAGCKYATPSWTPQGDAFYYTWLPVDPSIPIADRPGYAEIRLHRLGTDPGKDEVVHPRTGRANTFLGAELARDGSALVVTIATGWTQTTVLLKRRGEETLRTIFDEPDAQANVFVWDGHVYAVTNSGAPRWRVLKADLDAPERSSWKEIVPEAPASVLEAFDIIGGHLVLDYMENAASRIEVRTLDGEMVRAIPLPGIGSASAMVGLPEDDEAYFGFASFTHPPEIYRVAMRPGEVSLWSAIEIPVDASAYEVSQVFYSSKDGTRVSMFLVHRKDLVKDGSTPFLLTGYGGFNVSLLPAFNPALFPWLEAGGGFAVPNLRGGGEYGEDWHRAGMGAKKQNVFDDFIAAAEYLVREGYTRPERLAIRGGSNGGLLMGAAMTQRPDLFRAVVCQVPLLDMVRYHMFGSGKTWAPEYGSADNEAEFRTLYAYSPYHHVRPGVRYPSLLMLSADSDDRVDPMHARKMTAMLQAVAPPDRPVWLRIERHSGHGGADLVRQAVDQSADTLSWLFDELGIKGSE